MNCSNNVDLLVRRAAGQLSKAELGALEEHLRECANCREAAAAQNNLWGVLDEWRPPAVSADFDHRLQVRIAAAEAEGPWARVWRAVTHGFSWRLSLSVAGACAVLLALVLLRPPLVDLGQISTAAPAAAQKPIDIDQVENALDDVDMLSLLGVDAPIHAPNKADSGS
jgi:hypothetical protein